MKIKQVLFISSVLGIIILLFLSTINKEKSYTVEKVVYGKDKIEIKLENNSETFIVFSNQILNLTKGDRIFIEGQEEIFRNRTQIIVNKIEKR